MKKLAHALLFLALVASTAHAQSGVVTLPYAAQAVADIGNGPIKVRVTQGNAAIFTSQGSGVGSTSGSSTSLVLTGTPTTPPCAGCQISGSGITSGTTVAAYNGTTGITLSSAMTVPASTAVAWGAACPSSAPVRYIQASTMADYYLLYTQARVCAVSPGGPANTLLLLPVFYDQTTAGGGGGSVSFANPTATAGPTAVNGIAVTAMRSDAAPAVRLASASQSGLMPQWPGTTTTFFRGDGSFQTLNPAAINGLGTGIATALGVNVGSAGAPILFNGALGTPTSGTVATGITLNYSAVTSAGTVPSANLPLVANTTGSPSATAGIMKCDGTTITCASGVVSAAGGSSTPGGSNTQFQYNSSGSFGGAANFAYVGGVPTITNNSVPSFVVRDAASSSSNLSYSVQTCGGLPVYTSGGPWVTGCGNIATTEFTANSSSLATMWTKVTNGTMVLSSNGSGNTNPTLAISDSGNSCCYIPILGVQPGFLFTYGQQATNAYPAVGPGPMNFNIASYSLNTGAGARDSHVNIFSGQDDPNHAQPGIAMWLVNSGVGVPQSVCATAGTCFTRAGDNIWEIGGFPYATNGFVESQNSIVRGTNDQDCTNTGASPVEGNTSCGGNIVFINIPNGSGFLHVRGMIASGGTLALGEYALSNNGFTGGAGTITLKNGTCPTATTGAGVLCVESGSLKFRGSAGTLTTLGPA